LSGSRQGRAYKASEERNGIAFDHGDLRLALMGRCAGAHGI
jgi:hypothetical protein